jgi:hypothetical protein
VDDLAAFRRRVVEAGGKILMEEQAVPGMGSFALFAATGKPVRRSHRNRRMMLPFAARLPCCPHRRARERLPGTEDVR